MASGLLVPLGIKQNPFLQHSCFQCFYSTQEPFQFFNYLTQNAFTCNNFVVAIFFDVRRTPALEHQWTMWFCLCFLAPSIFPCPGMSQRPKHILRKKLAFMLCFIILMNSLARSSFFNQFAHRKIEVVLARVNISHARLTHSHLMDHQKNVLCHLCSPLISTHSLSSSRYNIANSSQCFRFD